MREHFDDHGKYAIVRGAETKDYQAQLKLTDKYAVRFGMEESENNFSRHAGNNYMMHAQRGTYNNCSGVTYQAPCNYNSGSSTVGAVITRGVPSQEIRMEDEQNLAKKQDEKESHRSRHIDSRTSFGGQQQSYLMQQHQATLGHYYQQPNV